MYLRVTELDIVLKQLLLHAGRFGCISIDLSQLSITIPFFVSMSY